MSCHHINTTPDKRQLIQCIIFQSSCFNSVVFFISISANPKSLLNTVWLNNGVFCGFRGETRTFKSDAWGFGTKNRFKWEGIP